MTGTPRPFTGLGFTIGSVRGVRTFRYINRLQEWAHLGDAGVLAGLYYPQVWGPGENIAECRKSDREFNYFGKTQRDRDYEDERVDIEVLEPQTFDPVPSGGEHMPRCHCGFYAYYDGSNDYHKPDAYGPDLISAVVEGWGEVLIGARGFRCTRARIVALHIPDWHPARELILVHYPDAAVFGDFDRMVKTFPEEDGGVRAEYRAAQDAAREARKARLEAEAAAKAKLEDDGGPVI